MNKKGSEKYLSPWNIFIWVIVIGAVVSGISISTHMETDVRPAEARLLAVKIADCIVQDGQINEDMFSEDFDIFKACSLKKEVIENGKYLIDIQIEDLETNETRKRIAVGNTELRVQCEINGNEDSFAACYSDRLVVSDTQDKQTYYLVKIKTASNNIS